MIIAVDFDGTMVTHRFPDIGADIGAFSVLRELQEAGHKLILFTMRSDEHLAQAEHVCRKEKLNLYGVNTNPTQSEWTNSPKAYAHLYIDDAAYGIPLVKPAIGRPYVNWKQLRIEFKEIGLLDGEAEIGNTHDVITP